MTASGLEVRMNQAPSIPVNIVQALALLLCCQLAGEVIVAALHQVSSAVAFPGPVVGMALLFAMLLWRGNVDASLEATSTVILRNLSLLFVPAAVGIIQQRDLVTEYGLILFAAILVSTVVTLLVTVGVFIAIARWMKVGDEL
jgi:holin-like protein